MYGFRQLVYIKIGQLLSVATLQNRSALLVGSNWAHLRSPAGFYNHQPFIYCLFDAFCTFPHLSTYQNRFKMLEIYQRNGWLGTSYAKIPVFPPETLLKVIWGSKLVKEKVRKDPGVPSETLLKVMLLGSQSLFEYFWLQSGHDFCQ